MPKSFVAAATVAIALVAVASDTQAPIPREGRVSGTMPLAGPIKVLPLGNEQIRMTYETTGMWLGEPGDLLHNSSVRCIGALSAVNGASDDEAGSCVYTRPDGDKAFGHHSAQAKVAVGGKGTFTFVGGTGKLAGLTGGGEFTRYSIRPAADGTTQVVLQLKGTYRLPASSAGR